MIRRSLFAPLVVLLGAASFAGAGAQSSPAPRAASSSVPSTPVPAPTLAPTPPAEPSTAPSAPAAVESPRAVPSGAVRVLPFAIGTPPVQTYAAFSTGASRQPGVIDLVRKDDELYFDLRPENFNRSYIILPSIERGVGGEAFAGRVYDPIVVTFKKVGKRVLWITPNSRYVAEKGSAAANSLAVSVGDTVLLSTPIIAEESGGAHTVIAPSVFLTDFEGIGADLGRSGGPASVPGLLFLVARPSFSIDATKSYYGSTKAFPRNDEVSVNLAFNGPANALPTVPDGRGIPVTVHYSIVAPPQRDPNFVPRNADDRVGYFITARKRYGNDSAASPFERFIERWNVADGPITFYLTDEIPAQYRDTVRRGILAWNDAFAKAGHPGAIVVRDRPADPAWDPDDARYTTVRWITSDQPDFAAYSPHVSDPETGQIIRAEVVIDGESLRSIKSGFSERALPVQRTRASAFADPQSALASAALDEAASPDAQECTLEEGSLVSAMLGAQLLALNPRTTAADRERYAQQWLYATVMHEVGHTLGLRHNFEASTAFTYAQLHDPAFTAAHGTTGSVMDYTPANIAGPGERQAAYFPTRLGPYDYWAIAYGYRTFPNVRSSADEAIPLSRIAARSTEPGLAYGTDEDLLGTAVDPRIAAFDLSSDPLAYVDEQFRIDRSLATRLLKRYPGDRRSYQDIRTAFITLLENQLSSSILASHYVGGIYTSRAHRDEPGAAAPFAPVPRGTEQRAFELLRRNVLSSAAFAYDPELLNAAAPNRFGIHWGASTPRRADFPIREVIAEIQDATLVRLFSPANLARIADEELKAAPGRTMSLADLFAWTNAAIYDDLGAGAIAPAHRELQRRFTDLQMQIASLPAPVADQLSLPRETQSLARSRLVQLAARLDARRGGGRDEATRAHLEDLRARVHSVLEARNIRAI